MHKLKRIARQEAWYVGEDGERTLNPFGKSRPPRRGFGNSQGGDIESGLDRIRSEGETLGSDERKRKSQFEGNVLHPSTMPTTSSSSGQSISNIDTIGKVVDDSEAKEDSQESQTRTSDILLNDKTSTSHSVNEPRKRRFHGVLDRLNHDDKKEPHQDRAQTRKEKKFTLFSQVRYTIFNSWINVLIIAAPVGIALHFTTVNPIAVFVVNFIAIIPLAAMLSYATEEISLRTGETIGGLLNASFGNAVELIVSIIALFQDQIVIVQTSLIGSMLSNLLLVMGMCFFFGGLNRVEQHFNVTVAQTAASLLALAIGSLIIPTAFNRWADLPGSQDDVSLNNEITELSRGTAILLLLVYGCYLFFQLRTHVDMYNEPSKKAPKRHRMQKGDATKEMMQAGAGASAQASSGKMLEKMAASDNDDNDEADEPQLSLFTAIFTLCWSTALVGVCAEFLVDSIDYVTENSPVSRTFVGLILLPIVGNAAEHATAVTVACKDKMDLAIGVAVGSSMQIALLVLPLVVTIGWIAGKPDMNLSFDGFEVIVLFVAVLLVNYLIGDGKSHWLEGVLLMTLYLIIAVSAWFFPNDAAASFKAENFSYNDHLKSIFIVFLRTVFWLLSGRFENGVKVSTGWS